MSHVNPATHSITEAVSLLEHARDLLRQQKSDQTVALTLTISRLRDITAIINDKRERG